MYLRAPGLPAGRFVSRPYSGAIRDLLYELAMTTHWSIRPPSAAQRTPTTRIAC